MLFLQAPVQQSFLREACWQVPLSLQRPNVTDCGPQPKCFCPHLLMTSWLKTMLELMSCNGVPAALSPSLTRLTCTRLLPQPSRHS